MPPVLEIEDLQKTFVLHLQDGTTIPVLDGLGLEVRPGECVVLRGASGTGKSTLLRLVYANYKADAGRILIRHGDEVVDMASAPPRRVLEVRRRTLGYVSQFLRVIPRVPAQDVVAEPLLALGVAPEEARARAQALLARLNIPRRLWALPPATFSGGEQQRVNVARGFIHCYPCLLLDEPTAALDAANRRVVIELIEAAKARGAAIMGIFHDEEVRTAVGTRFFDLDATKKAA